MVHVARDACWVATSVPRAAAGAEQKLRVKSRLDAIMAAQAAQAEHVADIESAMAGCSRVLVFAIRALDIVRSEDDCGERGRDVERQARQPMGCRWFTCVTGWIPDRRELFLASL